MKIYFEEENMTAGAGLKETMEKAACKALDLEGLPEDRASLSVTFVSLDEIHDLNREYRNVDRPTDVLSFPQFEREDIREYAEDPDCIPEELMLGDVVISIDKAREQAEELGHSFERELIYLFTHSVLHLLGYDHEEEEEKKEMRQREEEIMNWLGIPRV